MENGSVTVLDARRGRDWSSSEFIIKGAHRTAPGKFSNWKADFSKDQKLVLYCAWPNEFTSASLAQKLMAEGFADVHALKGGWREWFRAKFSVEEK